MLHLTPLKSLLLASALALLAATPATAQEKFRVKIGRASCRERG